MALVLLGLLYAASAATLTLATRSRAARRIRPSLLVAIFLSALPLAFTFDGFQPRRTLAPTPVLAQIAPWHDARLIAAVARDASPPNPLLLDPLTQMVPWDRAARDSLLFNASQGAGAALLGNGQSALLFPTEAAARWLPPFRAVTYRQAARLLIAAWGMFVLVRILGWSDLAGAAAAAVFVGSGFLQLWRLHPHSNVAAVAPWILAIAVVLVRRPGPRTAALLALALAAGGLGGHPETLLHVALFTAVAAPALAGVGVEAPIATQRRALARGAWAACAGVSAFLLAAPALLPLIENLTLSVEWTEFRGERRSHADLPLTWALQRLAPVAALVALGDPRRATWSGPENLVELGGGAVGAPALLLAAIALAAGRRRTRAASREKRRLLLVLLLGLLGVMVSAHVPLVSTPFIWMPLVRDSLLTRLSLWWVLAGSILAGAGCAAIQSRRVGTGAALTASACVTAIVLLAQRSAPFDELPRIRALELAPLLVLLLPVLWAARRTTPHPSAAADRGRRSGARLGPCLAVALALAALVAPRAVLFARWIPVTPIAGFYPVTPSIDRVAGRLAALPARGWRVSGTYAALVPHSAAFYGFEEIRAYDPVTFAPYRKFLGGVGVTPRHGWVEIIRPNGPILDYLGVRFLFDHPTAKRRGRNELLHRGDDGVVWERYTALPRAFFPRTLEVQEDPAAALEATTHVESFAETAIVSSATGLPPGGVNPPAEVVELVVGRGAIHARVDASGNAVLVTSQPAIPGWRLSIDGEEASASARRVNGAFLGALVPRGSHQVELLYAPRSFTIGLTLAAIGAAIVVTLPLLRWFRRAESAAPAQRAAE